jgi:hypothetical protein
MTFKFWPFRNHHDDVDEIIRSIKEKSVVTPIEYPPMPEVQAPRQKNEFYRVGWDSNSNMVTLTLTPDGGYSTTLSISPAECERMIRMLRSAYVEDETPTNEVD